MLGPGPRRAAQLECCRCLCRSTGKGQISSKHKSMFAAQERRRSKDQQGHTGPLSPGGRGGHHKFQGEVQEPDVP
eukprot:3580573-Pyramimonas_sp.AAC.1